MRRERQMREDRGIKHFGNRNVFCSHVYKYKIRILDFLNVAPNPRLLYLAGNKVPQAEYD